MPVEPLHVQAESNLRYIREKMEHASRFTGVPGWGGMIMGGVGVVAALIASSRPEPEQWIVVWLVAAVVATLVGGWSMDRKARAAGTTMLADKGRRFLFGLLPPLVAGGAMTVALFASADYALIPGVWLLMYGTACVTGGAHSIRLIPLMGICFMGLGFVAILAPATWGNWFLAAGFGGLQLGFGFAIGRWHGG